MKLGQRRAFWALNLTNFFVAEVMGVVFPFLTDFLREKKWHYDAIGVAGAVMNFGVLMAQVPAGVLVDKIPRTRVLFTLTSIILGAAYALLPFLPKPAIYTYLLLAIAGVVQAFLAPLMSALALRVGGHSGLNRVIGHNQAYNHAGNILTAILAVVLVRRMGTAAVFYATFLMSLIAAITVYGVGSSTGQYASSSKGKKEPFRALLHNRSVWTLLGCATLFNLAGAPVTPLLALYLRHLGGNHEHIAALILVPQAVMVPVAFIAAMLGDNWGRKKAMAISFWLLPLRCLLCAWCKQVWGLVALQVFDGVIGGLYGVILVSICGDLVGRGGQLNTLVGMATMAMAIGAIAGPSLGGLLVEHLGFTITFLILALVAFAAAQWFWWGMPETQPETTQLNSSDHTHIKVVS